MLNKDQKRGLTIALRIVEENMRKIFGILPSCWEIIENVKTKRLKRYGDVQDGLDNVLDPQLNRITDLILEVEQVLGSISK